MAKKTTKTTKKSTPKKVNKVETEVKAEVVNNEIDETVLAETENDDIEVNQEPLNESNDVSEVKEEVDQDPPLEVMNGDPTVVTTIDKIEEEAMAETFKENKKKRLIDNMIGYSWNGQEIDYIL